MKRYLFIIAIALLQIGTQAQTLNNTLLGFQEPTTKIQSIANDGGSNIYYFGLFKGALVRNNQTLLTGNGGEDLFIIKTDTSGNLIWAKNYGGAGSEIVSSPNNFKYSNGALFFSNYITNPNTLGSITIDLYGADLPASCIVRIDTATGEVVWAKKTSLLVNNLQVNNSILMVSGNLTNIRGPWLFENQTLQDSSEISRYGIMFIDKNGNYKNKKQLFYEESTAGGSTPLIQTPQLLNSGSIIFYVLSSAGAAPSLKLKIEDSTVTIPSQKTFQAILRTDTSFKNIQYRIINNLQGQITINSGQPYNTFSFNKNRDSLYFLMQTSMPYSYTLDGYNYSLQNKNTLIVMDSNLVTARVQTIGTLAASNRISYQAVTPYQGHLYFLGTFLGTNQAPSIIPMTANNQSFEFMTGLNLTVNVNGPTKSFLIKTTPDLSQKVFQWLGDATPYDGTMMNSGSINTGNNRIYMVNLQDDLWNPWIIDTELNIQSGAMIGNSDRAEISRLIHFFKDGSRFVVGEGYGKTAFDTSYQGIVKFTGRRDIFFTKLGTDNKMIWYKRIFSSFRSVQTLKTVMKNDKVYVLINLNSPSNSTGYNYIKIDTIERIVNTAGQYCALLVFDAEGKTRLIDLNTLPAGKINSFDIYDNEEIAAISASSSSQTTINGVTFPRLQPGYFILRLDANGNIINALRYCSTTLTTTPNPWDIIIHSDNETLKIIGSINFQSNTTSGKMIFTNGAQYNDTLIINNPKYSTTLNRMFIDVIQVRSMKKMYSTQIGPVTQALSFNPPMTLNNNNLYIPISRNNIKDSLFQNSQIIDLDTSSYLSYILGIDTLGRILATQKFVAPKGSINPYAFNITKLRSYGNHIYASGGITSTMKVDTIQIGYAGSTDAITIQFDTALNAKKVFRLNSMFYENMNDCAVYNDSIISFAYAAQGLPTLLTNKMSTIRTEDMDEDAYIGDISIKAMILPFEWVSFDAVADNKNALIRFSTINEINIKDFIIQHSINGTDWTNLSTLASKGQQQLSNYSYTHLSPSIGKHYYRLRGTARDGSILYSTVKDLIFKEGIFQVLENPVKNKSLKIEVFSTNAFAIFNGDGQIIWRNQLIEGTHYLNLQKLNKGLYIIRSGDQSEKIILP